MHSYPSASRPPLRPFAPPPVLPPLPLGTSAPSPQLHASLHLRAAAPPQVKYSIRMKEQEKRKRMLAQALRNQAAGKVLKAQS